MREREEFEEKREFKNFLHFLHFSISPSTKLYIFPSFVEWMYLHCLFFLKRQKKHPTQRLKFFCPEKLISIYIAAQKT
jgi:hypothetical protein